MEIFGSNNQEEIGYQLTQLINSKLGDTSRLRSLKDSLERGDSISEDDIYYINKNFKEYQLISENFNKQNEEETKQIKTHPELQIIQKLQQSEIGNFARLESIKNYLIAGQSLLNEDLRYLNEQYEKLKKVLGINFEDDFKPSKSKSTNQTILIDEAEIKPTHNFTSLSHTISKIIGNSTPHFTIGIYGEWGTGKTTLMKAIERDLAETGVSKKEQKILPVWFNAWRYERDETLATLSLMKTVAFALENHEKFDPVSKTIFKGLTIVGKDLMQEVELRIISSKNSSIEGKLDEKMDQLNKLYRDSIYFEGLDKIKRQMEKVRKNDNEYRVVIFIDDLDRCSPQKALEVIESIKLFLDIEGFIFVIGLSYKTVTKLITNAYKTTGLSGEDYIKKIIQIPIKIPTWSKENIVDLIENKIISTLNSDYTKFLSQNSNMIARVVDNNPRQLKRFINNAIIAFETFVSNENSTEIQFNEIFLVKILKSEWPDFYDEFVSEKDFRELIKWICGQPKELRKYFKYISTPTDEDAREQKEKRVSFLSKLSDITQGRISSKQIEILTNFDLDTWIFLDNMQEVVDGIENWNVINSVMDVMEEFSYDSPIKTKKTISEEEINALSSLQQDFHANHSQ